jgi:hypothetical protein
MWLMIVLKHYRFYQCCGAIIIYFSAPDLALLRGAVNPNYGSGSM